MTLCQFNQVDDIRAILAALPEADSNAIALATDRQGQLTKPPGSLGRLEDIAIFLAAWQGVEKPRINHPLCLIFAGNHGVAAQGVSAFPSEVTAQMVANFSHGGAAINQLTRAAQAELQVHPIDLDTPTADFTTGPAMTGDEMLHAMTIGAEAVKDEADILLVGEMGIANTTSATAIAMAVFGGDASQWAGRGTGIDDDGLKRKQNAVTAALKANAAELGHGAGIMASLGGRELAAIAGAVMEARMRRLPVLVDGFITTAALLPFYHDNRAFLDHCIISHRSAEPGHALMLEKTGKTPLIDFNLRLGEGSGAALALPIIRAAAETHSGMATFAEAGVSGGE